MAKHPLGKTNCGSVFRSKMSGNSKQYYRSPLNQQSRDKHTRRRQGIGAIIGGTILAVIIFTSVFIYFMTALQTQSEKGRVDIQASSADQDKKVETFEVSTTSCPNPCPSLPIIVNNTGPSPLNATWAMAYPTDNPGDRTFTQLSLAGPTGTEQVLNPGQSAAFAVAATIDGSGNIDTSKTFHVDIISSRGNIESVQWDSSIGSGGGGSGDGIDNGGQRLGCGEPPGSTPGCENVYAGKSGIDLQFYSLKQGVGITITRVGNDIVIDSSSLGTIIGAQNVGTGEGHVYKDQSGGVLNLRELHGTNGISITDSGDNIDIGLDTDQGQIIGPQIQALFPNPFGVSAGLRPLWGAVIANPTDHPMVIKKLVISVQDPTYASQRILCGAGLTAVTPATTWSCVGQGSTWNVLQWTGSQTIVAHDARLFLATSGDPVTAANNDRPSVGINFNVYTDFGQFTKVGYDFGVRGAGTHPMVNTFLAQNSQDKTPSNVIGVINVQSGTVATVRASIANYVPSTTVDNGASIIIDVPRAFTNVNIAPNPPAGFTACTKQTFADGSTQISCTLQNGALNNAGAASNVNVKTVLFTMTAPTVTTTKEYGLYVLGDGTTDAGAFTMGPISENVVRVYP